MRPASDNSLEPSSDLRVRNARVPMRQKIRVRSEGQTDDVAGTLLDLSEGGMAIQCDIETTVGSTLWFGFRAPGSGVEVSGEGCVAWIYPDGNDAGDDVELTAVGLEFSPLDEVARQEILRIVHAEGGLKTELQRAEAEVARLRRLSQDSEKVSHRADPDDEQGFTGALDLVEEASADHRRSAEEIDRREEALCHEIRSLRAIIFELESRDTTNKLLETTLLWETAEFRVHKLRQSRASLEKELEEAREFIRDTLGLRLGAREREPDSPASTDPS